MVEDLPADLRVELSAPVRLDESHWICLGKLKARRIKRTEPDALPALSYFGSEDPTQTLFILKGSGENPEAAIRDATERLGQYAKDHVQANAAVERQSRD